MKSVSVIIPCYNEEKRLANCAKELSDHLKRNFEKYEIVFSNDGSVDSTLSVAKEAALQYDNITVLTYEKNKGKGGAVRNGMLNARNDVLIYTDCDLAYGCDVIKKAVELIEEKNFDIIIGSRNLESSSYESYTFLRKVMSKVYFKLIAFVSGFKHSDSQCGFKAFKKEAAKDIFSECEIDSFAFDLEALIKGENKGYTIGEMPVKILRHDESESKIRPVRDTLKMLKDIRRIRKNEKKAKKSLK